MTQPNIIFFMVDQLAAKWLEAAMDGICDLLNIQRLKSQGASFTNAITSLTDVHADVAGCWLSDRRLW